MIPLLTPLSTGKLVIRHYRPMDNSLQAVTDKLLAQGLTALREAAFMPLIVNRDYEATAGQKGSTVDVPIPSAIETQDVTASTTPPSTADVSPTSISVPLDQWKEAPFYLTDKDRMEVEDGQILPMQASEAIKSLANTVNEYLLNFYKSFYGWAGSAGSAPFSSDTGDARNARKVLNKQLAPLEPRTMVIDPDAEANALGLTAFADMSFSGSSDAVINGELDRKLGFQWMTHQLVKTHTPGTAISGGKTITLTSDSSADATSVTLDVDSGTGTLVEGDIITFAGHDQTYVVTADATLTTSGVAVSIQPGLKQDVDGSGVPVAVTGKAEHVANLAMHRDAIAFATRPLEGTSHPSAVISTITDPMSGLTLRLENTREHKRDRWSYDILYGAQVVRRALGCRVAG